MTVSPIVRMSDVGKCHVLPANRRQTCPVLDLGLMTVSSRGRALAADSLALRIDDHGYQKGPRGSHADARTGGTV